VLADTVMAISWWYWSGSWLMLMLGRGRELVRLRTSFEDTAAWRDSRRLVLRFLNVTYLEDDHDTSSSIQALDL
jgi:hypothetical protein